MTRKLKILACLAGYFVFLLFMAVWLNMLGGYGIG